MKTNFRLLQALSNLQEQTKKESERLEEKQENLKEKQDDLLERQIKLEEEQKEIEEKQNKIIKETKEKVDDIKINMPKDGKDGRDGERGPRGERGERGLTGERGPQGERGLTGERGPAGARGEDGVDGVGIYNIELDKEFHLIITLTDGRRIDCGYVRGQAGMNGYGVNGISVTNAEIRNGHLYITLSNGTEIDAGVVSGGGPGGEETDPIFTASPAYNITSQDITNWNNKSSFSGDYNDLTNKPTIPTVPTNVSAFTNDAGYLTQHQDISGKYDKTGGEITGNVKIDGTLTLDIEDEDYDAGIRFDKRLDDNLGTILTLTGYANGDSPTNYKPVIRNVATPHSDYDVANKKYVDDNVVLPTYYLTFLNADGTIDTVSSTLNYNTVLSNLSSPKEADYLDIFWGDTRFYAKCIETTDVNNGDLKFIGEVEYQGIQRYMVFTLTPNNVLTTTNIITFESVSNKVSSIISNSTSTDKYPNTKAVFDEFQRKPVVIWESNDPTQYLKGIQADISASPSWQLTNLDMTPYKRIKIYSCAGQKSGATASASTTPAIVLEMSLDSRNAISAYGGNYVGSILVQKPNDANRYASLTCAVSADKTKFVVLRQSSLYGTAATGNNDANANVFMIEGYYD